MINAEKLLVNVVKRRLVSIYGVDLSYYKDDFLRRRIRARMVSLKISNPWRYVRLLEESPEEVRNLLDNVSINVSRFMRDAHVWSVVMNSVFRVLVSQKMDGGTIRIWSAGCSHGEEPYTVAILLSEMVEKAGFKPNIRVYATDIDLDALQKAREGVYRREDLRELGVYRLLKFFTHLGNGLYRVNEEVKQLVVFKRHDLLKDRYFRDLDAIFCRNVLIYFNKEAQKRVLYGFSKALRPGGFLILGATESMPSEFLDVFKPVSLRARVYRLVM